MNTIRRIVNFILLIMLIAIAALTGFTGHASAGTSQAVAVGWNVVMVDNWTSPDVGRRPSIAIHPVTQRPYVTYYDAANGALRLAVHGGADFLSCGSWGWDCTQLDNVGKSGEASALRFGPTKDGAYAIAYTDPAHADVKLRQVGTDGSTSIHTVVGGTNYDLWKGPSDGGNDLVNTPSLAFQADQPLVAYYRSFRDIDALGDTRDSGVGFANFKFVADKLTEQSEDSRFNSDENAASDHGLFASLDIAETDNTFYVAYREQENQVLKYGYPSSDPNTACFFTGSNGQDPNYGMRCKVVDPAPKTGAYITLSAPQVLPSGGSSTIQIAYYDGVNGRVKYAKFVGGNTTCGAGGSPGWQCAVIDNVGTSANPMGVSMAVDSQGNPVIAYYDHNDTNHGILKVARLAGNDAGNCGPSAGLFPAWTCTVVDDGGADDHDVGQWAAVALDNEDKAYVAYFNSTEKALMVAHEKSDKSPYFSVSADPATVQKGATTTLTYKIQNYTDYYAVSGLSFNHGLLQHTFVPNTLQTTCGNAQLSMGNQNHAIKLTGATLAADSTCTITVKITADTEGTTNMTTTTLKSNEADDSAPAETTLVVVGPNTPVPTATPIPPTAEVPTATPPSDAPTSTPTTPNAPTSTPTTGNPNLPTSTPTTGNPNNSTSIPTTGIPDTISRVYLPFVRR